MFGLLPKSICFADLRSDHILAFDDVGDDWIVPILAAACHGHATAGYVLPLGS